MSSRSLSLKALKILPARSWLYSSLASVVDARSALIYSAYTAVLSILDTIRPIDIGHLIDYLFSVYVALYGYIRGLPA